MRESGRVACWGGIPFAQDGSPVLNQNRFGPAEIANLGDVAQVVHGTRFECVRHGSGRVQCWGINTEGALGAYRNVLRIAPLSYQASWAAVRLEKLGECVVMSAMSLPASSGEPPPTDTTMSAPWAL